MKIINFVLEQRENFNYFLILEKGFVL